MPSTVILKNVNQTVSRLSGVLEAFSDPYVFAVLHLLHKRGVQSPHQIASELKLTLGEVERIIGSLERGLLVRHTDAGVELTSPAKKRLAHGSDILELAVGTTVSAGSSVEHPLSDSYVVKERIGRGATSVTFRAEQSGTHRDRTLKVFLPGAATYPRVDEALRRLATLPGDAALPEIVDAGQTRLLLSTGESTLVSCVALRYIDQRAKTFSDFLRAHVNLTPNIFELFIQRVGGALAAIEAVGLQHGDLHEGNILVVSNDKTGLARDFWVIDYIGIPSIHSPELEVPSDIENFRDHLLRAAVTACGYHPGYSARLLLGERVFRVLQNLREGTCKSFAQLLDDFSRPTAHIPSNHFRARTSEPFEWLRVEWFPSPDRLYRLFEPVQSRFETISRFGNTWISGPRGSGKSHYLRVLAFHPQVVSQAESDADLYSKLKQINYDFRKAFGVLFACRLGEFKAFTPEVMGQDRFDPQTQAFLKHVLVLKIWNKTFHTIREGVELADQPGNRTVLSPPNDLRELIEFLEVRFGRIAVVDDSNIRSMFLQCLAATTARENSAVAVWHDPSLRAGVRLLNEGDLDAFFTVVKHTFPDLAEAQFFILVDDASYGHVHFEMQKVLNSLVRAVQANHCFKITCDKFLYTLETADRRAIDPRHEVTYVDLGEVSAKVGRPKVDMATYMGKVINLRLRAAQYQNRIEDILGPSQSAREFLSALSLPGARRPRKGQRDISRPPRPHAYYAGWNIVWTISHGSIRNLLELVEHIFKTCGATPQTPRIPLNAQDAAVKTYATRQFKALSMLPGEIDGEAIGLRLQAVISAIGEISRQYLEKYDTGESHRYYETISVERLDRSSLSSEAQRILEELVKYGLLLDEGITFSRAQLGLLQRYDMNKIFAPAFLTTYRVRNHMYLSQQRFEELLLKPDVFARRSRKKLGLLAQRGRTASQKSLFNEEED